jgi:hypothetical protein
MGCNGREGARPKSRRPSREPVIADGPSPICTTLLHLVLLLNRAADEAGRLRRPAPMPKKAPGPCLGMGSRIGEWGCPCPAKVPVCRPAINHHRIIDSVGTRLTKFRRKLRSSLRATRCETRRSSNRKDGHREPCPTRARRQRSSDFRPHHQLPANPAQCPGSGPRRGRRQKRR